MTATDVVVIGGGIMGAALTYELARGGASVTLLERDQLCAGSSGRNAGGVRHQFSLPLNVALARRSIVRYQGFADEFGVDVGLVQCGYLFLAGTPELEATFRRMVDGQRRAGVPGRWVTPDEIAELVPGIRTDDLLGGALGPDDGYLDPSTVVAGFAAAARRHGARVRLGAHVEAIETSAGGERVTGVRLAGGERLASGTVVLATGVWAPQLAAVLGVELPIVPWRSQCFQVLDLPDLGSRLPMTIDYAHDRSYFHREGPGLVAGMETALPSELSWVPPVAMDQLPGLVERLAHRVPGLGEASIGRSWAGWLELTPDENPIADRAGPEGCYCVSGFSGHGLSLAPALAEEVARELTGRAPSVDLGPYRLGRFAPDAAAADAEDMAMR